MSFLMKSFLSVFLLALSWGYAEITPIFDWDPVIQAVDGASPKTSCVVFDVDGLTVSEDRLLQPMYQKIRKEYLQSKSIDEVKEIWDAILSKRKVNPVDPKVQNVLKCVQDKGLKGYAITSMWTEPFGQIASPIDWRIAELEELGLHFDLLSGCPGEYPLTKKTRSGNHGDPFFKQGVIFTAYFDSGEILFEALDLIEDDPKCVIFVDHSRRHLESVEKVCQARGIEFIGFEYKAVACQDCLSTSDEVVKYQMDRLDTGKEWMSDTEVEQELIQR